MRSAVAILLSAAALAAASPVTPIPNGISVQTVSSGVVRLTVESNLAFRVSVGKNGPVTEYPFLDDSRPAPPSFQTVNSGSMVGISVSGLGSVMIDPNSTQFAMQDPSGTAIVTSRQLLQPSGGSSICDTARPGFDAQDPVRISGDNGGALSGQTQESCCSACDSFSECTAWVYAPVPDQQDNCWLLKSASGVFPSSDRVFGGQTEPPTPIVGSTITLDADSSAVYYGSGAGQSNAGTLSRTSGFEHVENRESDAPVYWSSQGYSAIGLQAASWQARDGSVVWSQVDDLYLIPAADIDASTRGMWSITGAPSMLPRWALGFLASRWGWNSEEYINTTLPQFRQGNYPIDAYISDFSWFTAQDDYNCPSDGWSWYSDFGYSNLTYPHPKEQLSYYRSALNMRMMGIRKPRLCNTELLSYARSQGWLVEGGLNGRDLNYSIPAMRQWYSKNQAHFRTDGVAGYWNDEGEVYYFQFYWWNLAEVETLQSLNATERFFSINRAYTPGMQRMGAVYWTGDINPTWQQLQITPGYMLNQGIMGNPYTTCDIGGFTSQTNALLLTRWYQAGVFLPIVRVHSTESATPHFPFLWEPAAANAMRDALNLRYQLIPALNSLAYRAATEGKLIMRPLMASFFADTNTHDLTSQWLVGDSVMVAPVLNENNQSSTYFPVGSGTWYQYATTLTHEAGTTEQLTNVGLDYIPIYARAGAVLPLGPVVQYTDALPGGPLQVQVYAGADGSFTLVEDDGLTSGYTSGNVRKTSFSWDDASSTLSWTVAGTFSGPNVFTSVAATLYSAAAGKSFPVPAKAIGRSGSFKFST